MYINNNMAQSYYGARWYAMLKTLLLKLGPVKIG